MPVSRDKGWLIETPRGEGAREGCACERVTGKKKMKVREERGWMKSPESGIAIGHGGKKGGEAGSEVFYNGRNTCSIAIVASEKHPVGVVKKDIFGNSKGEGKTKEPQRDSRGKKGKTRSPLLLGKGISLNLMQRKGKGSKDAGASDPKRRRSMRTRSTYPRSQADGFEQK